MKEKQGINFFSLTMIVVSLVIGMGIFKTPATIAAKSGTPLIFFSAWTIGGIIALFGALTYAEIGQRLPVMGGYYKVFAHCYHPAVGFTINVLILISNAASLAVVALIGADYVSDLLFGRPSSTLFNIGIATSSVGLFYFVNLLGLKTSSRTQNVLMVVKISLIILLISSLFKGVSVPPHGYNEGKLYVYDGYSSLS
jgi:APA family basic amino acid/polyamine antiporter